MRFFNARILWRNDAPASCCQDTTTTVEEIKFNLIAKDVADAHSIIDDQFPGAKIEELNYTEDVGDAKSGLLLSGLRDPIYIGPPEDMPKEIQKRLQ